MKCSEKYNSERYLDMTAYLALKNIERKNPSMNEDWIYRRGDIYLANLDSIYPWDRGTNYAVELGIRAAHTIIQKESL